MQSAGEPSKEKLESQRTCPLSRLALPQDFMDVGHIRNKIKYLYDTYMFLKVLKLGILEKRKNLAAKEKNPIF